MRRNSRGGNRGIPAWQIQRQNSPRMPGGPALMSDQLGLQDIDKELDLLKRKREIIEQQQQILSTDYRRNDYRDSYNQNQNQNTRFDDYAQLYDDMRNFEPSRKRPIAVWEGEIPSKRFSDGGGRQFSSRGSAQRNAASRPPVRSGYQGSPSSQTFRTHSTPFKPKPSRRDPIPNVSSATNRVTKRSAVPPVNKLNTYPTPERKKLISTTLANAPKSYELDESNRLVADHEPNKHVNGRLELALGGVIRDIRDKYETIVKAPIVMRRIKQTVRRRIRDVMMNKIVGQGPAIKTEYRQVYDEDTDLEVVADALSHELKLIKIDNPKEYFKANMFVIMHMKLKSLLQQVENIALEEYKNAKPSDSDDGAQELPEIKPNGAADQQELPEIKPNGAADQQELPEIKPNGAADQSSPCEETTKDETPALKIEKSEETTAINIDVPSDAQNAENAKQLSNTLDEKIIDTETYKTLEMIMTKQMTVLLKKSIPQIIKLMDIDAKYAELRSKVAANTAMLLSKKGNPKQATAQNGDDSIKSNKTQTQPKRPPIPYFVKLMGKPSLPKRNQMQVFLDEFTPKSIKKHRAIHNLLFVGMMEKENFDKLLAADGTVIGKSTLSIRVSERSVPDGKANNSTVTADTSTTSDLNTSNSDEKLIGEELDEQITDLLSAIRQAENNEENDGAEAENADENAEAENANENAEADNADANAVADNADANAEADNADENAEAENFNDASEGVTESAHDQQDAEATQENGSNAEAEKSDVVTDLAGANRAGRGTPASARASARLAATPSRVLTRRSSKLVQNDA